MKLGVVFPGAVVLLGLSTSASAAQAQAGRDLVFLDADAGSEYLGLQTLKANCGAPGAACGLVDGVRVKAKDFGATYGAGLGVRLSAFTLGSRFRYGDFSDWQLWTLDAEAGVHVPLGRIEPYFTVGAGYASLNGIHSDFAAVSVSGLDVRTGAGLDCYLSERVSVGANLSGEVLFLGRTGDRKVRQQSTDPNALNTDWVYAFDGSGIGMGGTFTVQLGLHF